LQGALYTVQGDIHQRVGAPTNCGVFETLRDTPRGAGEFFGWEPSIYMRACEKISPMPAKGSVPLGVIEDAHVDLNPASCVVALRIDS